MGDGAGGYELASQCKLWGGWEVRESCLRVGGLASQGGDRGQVLVNRRCGCRAGEASREV